jgi:signal transduction histidine kinase
MGLLTRIGLQRGLTLLTGLTVAVAVSLLVYLGMSAIDKTEDRAERQRLTSTAQAMAGHVDDVLTRTMDREAHLSQMVANAWGRGEDELLTLLDAYPSFLFESELYLVRPPGDLVWSMRPGGPIEGGLSAEPLVRESLLLAQVDLGRPDLNLFSLEQLNVAFRIELVAAGGLIVASNQSDAGETSSHTAAVTTLSSLGNTNDPVASQHGEGGESNHPFGYAPISTVPGWSVVVEPSESAALAVAEGAEQRLLFFGLAVLAASLALVWLGSRHLVKPVGALAAAAVRMGRGDLSTPIAVARRDEVGEVAEVMESLRVALKDALADVQSAYEAQRLSSARGHLLGGLFARQEEERQQIAYELHERAMQSLSGLAMNMDLLGDEMAPTKQDALDRVARVRTLARELVGDLRRLVEDLRPPVLEHLGLAGGVRAYADSQLSAQGIQTSYGIVSGVDTRPPPELESTLYRVAQEAISNIAIHSEATSVRVTLKSGGGVLTLVVEDDGKGFDPAQLLADPSAMRGLGILSMRERTASIGGEFSVESTLGRGTRIKAEVPLAREGGEP